MDNLDSAAALHSDKPLPARRRSSRAGHQAVFDLHAASQRTEVRLSHMDRYVGYLVRRVDNKVYASFLDSLTNEDITPARFTALSIVGANPGVRQVDIARAMDIARPAALQLVNLLIKLGLVECHAIPGDKRSGALMLTAKGKRKLAQFEQRVLDHEARVFRNLGDDERLQLTNLLQRVLESPF